MVGRPTLVGGAGNRTGFDSLTLCQKITASIQGVNTIWNGAEYSGFVCGQPHRVRFPHPLPKNNSINTGGERHMQEAIASCGRRRSVQASCAGNRIGFDELLSKLYTVPLTLCLPTQTSLLQTPDSSLPMPQGHPPLAFQKSANPRNRSVQSHLDTRENPHRPRPDQNAAYL